MNSHFQEFEKREEQILREYFTAHGDLIDAIRSLPVSDNEWEVLREKQEVTQWLLQRIKSYREYLNTYSHKTGRKRLPSISSYFETSVADALHIAARKALGPDIELKIDHELQIPHHNQALYPDIQIWYRGTIHTIVELSLNKGWKRYHWCEEFAAKFKLYQSHPNKPDVRFVFYTPVNFIDRCFTKERVAEVFQLEGITVRGRGKYLFDARSPKNENRKVDMTRLWERMRTKSATEERTLKEIIIEMTDASFKGEAYSAIRDRLYFLTRYYGSSDPEDIIDPIETILDPIP